MFYLGREVRSSSNTYPSIPSILTHFLCWGGVNPIFPSLDVSESAKKVGSAFTILPEKLCIPFPNSEAAGRF